LNVADAMEARLIHGRQPLGEATFVWINKHRFNIGSPVKLWFSMRAVDEIQDVDVGAGD